MSSRWTKARPGDNPLKYFTASFQQALVDCIEWVKAQKDRRGAGEMIPGVDQPSNIVPVQNMTSGPLARFSIVGINQPVITPTANLLEFQNRFPLQGTTPTAVSHTGKFAVLLEPAAKGALARAALAGIVPVQVMLNSAVSAQSGPTFADVADGQTGYLVQNGSGAAQILWQDIVSTSYPATVWCIVRIGPPIPPVVIFRLNADLSYGSGNNANVWVFDGEALVNTGIGITLMGSLCDVSQSPYLTAAKQVPSGSLGAAVLLAGNWWIVACCPGGEVPWPYLATCGNGNMQFLVRGPAGSDEFAWFDFTTLASYSLISEEGTFCGKLLALNSAGTAIEWLNPADLPNYNGANQQYLGHNVGGANLVWIDP